MVVKSRSAENLSCSSALAAPGHHVDSTGQEIAIPALCHGFGALKRGQELVGAGIRPYPSTFDQSGLDHNAGHFAAFPNRGGTGCIGVYANRHCAFSAAWPDWPDCVNRRKRCKRLQWGQLGQWGSVRGDCGECGGDAERRRRPILTVAGTRQGVQRDPAALVHRLVFLHSVRDFDALRTFQPLGLLARLHTIG